MIGVFFPDIVIWHSIESKQFLYLRIRLQRAYLVLEIALFLSLHVLKSGLFGLVSPYNDFFLFWTDTNLKSGLHSSILVPEISETTEMKDSPLYQLELLHFPEAGWG